MGNVLIEETSLDSVGDAIREQLDVSTKYKVSEMPDAIRSISGGGGGTTNYNNLSNKPQINSVTLEGNKSLSDLSIQETLTFDSTPTDGSTNPVTSDGIYDAFAGVDTALSGKVDTTSVGVANGIAELDNDGLVPSSQLPDVDYTDVTNKPSINSVTLSGNKTATDLGLVNNTDLTDIIATGPTNATGNTITSGLYFYLDGVLCKAKSDIASGATFTLNTNYEVVTAGGLNSLNSALTPQSFAFSASSGVNINAGGSAFYKVGRQIHFNIVATLTSAWTTKYMVVGVLPVGSRPIIDGWLGVGANNAIDKPCDCIIGANGEVKLYRDDTASTTSIRAGGTFICAI